MHFYAPVPLLGSSQQSLLDQALDGVQLYYEKFTKGNICPLSRCEGLVRCVINPEKNK